MTAQPNPVPVPVPRGFPANSTPLTVRTASGHVHNLRAGWRVQFDATGLAPNVCGIAKPGYFISIFQPHIESLEQVMPVDDVPTTNGRPVADVPL